MNITALATNKQVLLALGMIVFVGAVVANGTGAFFSDTASATGNTFAAGTLELRIAQDSNGNPVNGWEETQNASWSFTNMTPGGDEVTDAVWLRNTGSVDGLRLGVAMANPAATVPGLGKQMRITEMTLGGNSLLEGGAGADIPEYESPVSCDTTVNPGGLVAAVTNAAQGETICVTAGTYNPGTLTLDDEGVTLVAVNAPDSGDKATIKGEISIAADNVTVRGFNLEATGNEAIVVNNQDGAVIEHNTFLNFGDINGTGNKQVVYLVNGSSDATIQYNVFDGVRNGNSSVKAIFVGHTGGATGASNIVISNNIISNVESADKGGYGILVNAAGATTDVQIVNNTFTNIDGGWMHAVGLEGDTPNAVVKLNAFSGLTADNASDAAAVFFESNPSASSVTINQNNFEADVDGVALHPSNQAGNYTIDATNNWWGDFDPSDQVVEVNSTIDTSNFAGGPFAGLVNGNDANGNGYADFQDLNNDPIIDAGAGLDGGEQKQFTMSVQLDGPTTGNEYQGASFTTDFVFTLNQV